MSRTFAFDALIIGAGAAGLMCALTAAARGRRVALLEHTAKIGAKILISGGGRCNFTNRDCRPERFLSENPHFARSALARYTAVDFIALVEKHKIAYYEKTLGQLFCDGAGAAKKIVSMLLAECAAGGVEIFTDTPVTDIQHADGFRLATARGAFTAPTLVIAAGGLSIPKLGATDFAYRVAAQFGAAIVPPAPALAPLTFGAADLAWMAPLSGVSLEAIAACRGARFREGLLFTHRGLSGPSILQVSSYWRLGDPINLDLDPDKDLSPFLQAMKRDRPKAELKTALSARLPQRLVEALQTQHFQNGLLAAQKDASLEDLARRLSALTLIPTGDEGYAKAEVTRGGVSTAALDQKTMMVKSVPGLFFIGEAVDVTGWLGGYNFQWAWSSGRAAGLSI